MPDKSYFSQEALSSSFHNSEVISSPSS